MVLLFTRNHRRTAFVVPDHDLSVGALVRCRAFDKGWQGYRTIVPLNRIDRREPAIFR